MLTPTVLQDVESSFIRSPDGTVATSIARAALTAQAVDEEIETLVSLFKFGLTADEVGDMVRGCMGSSPTPFSMDLLYAIPVEVDLGAILADRDQACEVFGVEPSQVTMYRHALSSRVCVRTLRTLAKRFVDTCDSIYMGCHFIMTFRDFEFDYVPSCVGIMVPEDAVEESRVAANDKRGHAEATAAVSAVIGSSTYDWDHCPVSRSLCSGKHPLVQHDGAGLAYIPSDVSERLCGTSPYRVWDTEDISRHGPGTVTGTAALAIEQDQSSLFHPKWYPHEHRLRGGIRKVVLTAGISPSRSFGRRSFHYPIGCSNVVGWYDSDDEGD